MKRIAIACLTGLLFLTACENKGSSTVGSYDKDETTQPADKKESETVTEKSKDETTSSDTLKSKNANTNNMNTMPSADSTK